MIRASAIEAIGPTGRWLLKLSILCSFLMSLAFPVHAWSKLGHQAVAIIAERHLTDYAEKRVSALLALEGDTSLADVASWADEVRKMKMPVQPNHAVWIPDLARTYDARRDCPINGCAVSSIDLSIKTLSNPKVNDQAKLLALKYLVHMVGDIHQPFHAIQAKGYIFAGKKRMTLHTVWDRILPAYPKLKPKGLAALVDSTEQPPSTFGDAEQWAWESHVIARDEIIPAAESFRFDDHPMLPKDYAEKNWPIASERLKDAGMRLAWTLNTIFKPD